MTTYIQIYMYIQLDVHTLLMYITSGDSDPISHVVSSYACILIIEL